MNGLAFYDWDNTELIRRIEIQPKHVSVSSVVASGRFIFGISEFLRSRRTLCTLLSWSHCAEYHDIYLRSAQNISSALESDNKHWLFVRIENVIQIPSAIHILNGLNKVNVLVEDRKLGNS